MISDVVKTQLESALVKAIKEENLTHDQLIRLAMSL